MKPETEKLFERLVLGLAAVFMIGLVITVAFAIKERDQDLKEYKVEQSALYQECKEKTSDVEYCIRSVYKVNLN